MLDINISDEEETDNRIDFKGQWFADDVIITISDQNEKLGSISVAWKNFGILYNALKKSRKNHIKTKKEIESEQ